MNLKLLKLKTEHPFQIGTDKMTIMCKEKTLEEIENILDHIRREYLKWLIKNCSSYMVTPEGNEHWLTEHIILTHWNSDTGYSRNIMVLHIRIILNLGLFILMF